jgi:hypothetical protein
MKSTDLNYYPVKNAFEKACKEILISESAEWVRVEDYIEELLTHKCSAGCCGAFVYYSDTLPFFEKHKAEIMELMNISLDYYGFSTYGEMIEGYDDTTPLTMSEENQNLAVWFAFEEWCTDFAISFDLDIHVPAA